jgi:hypothetical protein
MFQTTCLTPLTPLPQPHPQIIIKKNVRLIFFPLILTTCLTLVKTEIKINEELKLV